MEDAGFRLAKGRRIVLIDREGKIHSITRQIEGTKGKEIRSRLANLELPVVDEVRGRQRQEGDRAPKHGRGGEAKRPAEMQAGAEPEKQARPRKNAKSEDQNDRVQAYGGRKQPVSIDREEQDRQWQESIVDAAIRAEEAKGRDKGKTASRAARAASSGGQRRPAPAPTPAMLNALQDRHHRELGDFWTEKQQQRLMLSAKMEHQYGADERNLRRDIDELQQTLHNSGRLRIWWLKLTGRLSITAEADLENNRRTLENVEWRKREAQQGLESRFRERETAIKARYERERLALHQPGSPALRPESANQNARPQFCQAAEERPRSRRQRQRPAVQNQPARGPAAFQQPADTNADSLDDD